MRVQAGLGARSRVACLVVGAAARPRRRGCPAGGCGSDRVDRLLVLGVGGDHHGAGLGLVGERTGEHRPLSERHRPGQAEGRRGRLVRGLCDDPERARLLQPVPRRSAGPGRGRHGRAGRPHGHDRRAGRHGVGPRRGPGLGRRHDVHGAQFLPGSVVQVTLTPSGQVLAKPTVSGDGSFAVDVTIPSGIGSSNKYYLLVTGSGIDRLYKSLPIRVTVTGPRPTTEVLGRSFVWEEPATVRGTLWEPGSKVRISLARNLIAPATRQWPATARSRLRCGSRQTSRLRSGTRCSSPAPVTTGSSRRVACDHDRRFSCLHRGQRRQPPPR